MTIGVSLAELADAGIPLRPAEAVAVVAEVCRKYTIGELRGIPSPGILRLTRDGGIVAEGPVPTGEGDVTRVAQLLAAVLPGFDAPAEYRASGGLRLVIARAMGTLDLPPYESVDQFRAALVRFTTLDPQEAARELTGAWEGGRTAASLEPADHTALTISDIRRARRATGLTLQTISAAAGVPATRLRHLEWGDLRGWQQNAAGREQVVRYARAAGLDEDLVLSIAWPLVEEAGPLPIPLPAPASALAIVREPEPAISAPRHAPRAARAKWLIIPAGAAVLLVLAILPVGRRGAPVPEAERVTPAERHDAARVQPRPIATAGPAPSTQSPRMIQAMAYSPTFAPSGTAVYFHQQRGGTSALKRADTDAGGGVTGVTSILEDRSLNYHPRPSPDGSRVAFDSDRDGIRGVFVANADGTEVRRISGAGFASVPSWSPDGQQIAFVKAEPQAAHVWNLWSARADGTKLRRLTSHREGQTWGGSWFPDGRLAYSMETRLVVLDPATGATRTFPSPRPGRLVRTPAVSPDGRRIIFQVHRDGTWIVDLASGATHRVLSDPTAEEYTWAPDGQSVAFHSRRTGAWSVWTMRP